jgi:hypothetical protein
MSPLQRNYYKNLKATEVNMRRGSVASVKSVRDASTWVVIHVYMKAMLGIFLYIYP